MSGPERVLLLEPEIVARQPLAAYLRECGFKVVEAANAAEARTLLEGEHVAVDVVLADATGDAAAVFALAQWIRQANPGLPVILAGTIDRTIAQAGWLCGDGPAVVKPYDHSHVLKHIKRVLELRKKT